VLQEAHQGMAELLNARNADEIVFGANMTTLTFSVSRSIGRLLNRGDTILLTHMDHEGNVGPWMHLANDLGLKVKWLKFNLKSYEYDLNELSELLSEGNVRLAAINYASNCLGTVNDIKTITEMAHQTQLFLWMLCSMYLMDLQTYRI
jgi:selenocysteine lyase/cysteine desulfurase